MAKKMMVKKAAQVFWTNYGAKSKTKVKQSRFIFDTQLKISLRNVLGFPQSRLP